MGCRRRCQRFFTALTIAGASTSLGCGREGAARSDRPQVRLVAVSGRPAFVSVSGINDPNVRALRGAAWPAERWHELLRVTVADMAASTDSIAVAGTYTVTTGAVEFHPSFAFDPGRTYNVRFDPARLPVPLADSVIATSVSLVATAASARGPSVSVARILPTTDTVPANLLRMYIEFSGPMSRQSGVEFVHLLDDAGHEVPHAFLPLDADFWNPAHTRYTVFFDPGRVKRGILPNEQMGRPLSAGRRYTLVVDSAWRDADGQPLVHTYRHALRVGPAIERPIVLASWAIHSPRAGSRDPLVVVFPAALDHGLLQRAIGVETGAATPVAGAITVGPGERQWSFTPATAWSAGEHRLVVLAILEDVAGNRVGHAFEVDLFERVDSAATAERYRLPFRIR